ncbi:MAG: insulinase family protein, partial [Proteobacteria bacterium]|nr:insulinase family protein [Pseudomonadota bacterium]
MTQNIVTKGLAVQACAHNPDNRYSGMVILGGSPNEPDELKKKTLNEEERLAAYQKACEELENLLFAEVERLKTELVSTRELERIKKLNQRDFLDRMRSNEELAGTLATLEVEVGWNYLTTYLEEIAKVRPEEISAAAKKYLCTGNKTSVYIIPGGESDRPPEHYTEVRSLTGKAAAKEVKPDTFTNNSIYPTPAGWKHPLSFNRTPQKIEYPPAETSKVEGATIFYLPDDELPLIDLTLLIKAGAVDLPNDKIGLTRLLNGCLIRGGTSRYSPSELAMILDENAIQLSISVREEETVVKLSVMKNDWEKGLDLLKEIITRPRFDPGVFNVVKQQQMIALKRQGGDARTVCMREGIIWHFKGHPYGRDPLSGLETIPTIETGDLKAFLKNYFVPSNMVAAVSGDIPKSEAVKALRRLFLELPKGKAPERKLDEPAESSPVLALIHKPGQVQSQVNLFLRGIKRTNPDYWKMSLLMDILGGNDSLIYTRLRDDLGLIYSGWFYQTYKWKAGILVGYIGCKGDKTGEAIRETAKIMTSLKKDVPEKEIEQKRLDALNSFVFNVDTPAELVDVYSHYYLRKEPLDTLEKIQDAFMTATKNELEILARELLDQKKLQIFVVGDKNTLLKKQDGTEVTLEDDLKTIANDLGLPCEEIELR